MIKSYSLKYRTLRNCLMNRGIDDLIVISNLLQIRVSELKRRLKSHYKFDKMQISKLVYFLGAKNMFEIIYFPILKMKRKIYREIFGKTQTKGVQNG